MNFKAKKTISFLLVLVFLIGMLPMAVLAENSETVLTSISHPSAVSAVDTTGKTSATLTVPYNYSDTVDLSKCEVTYDKSVYDSVSITFKNGSEADVNGDPVNMTVTYQKQDNSVSYTTEYKIYVIKAAYTASTFTGTIEKNATLTDKLNFTAKDFTDKYVQNDGAPLDSIVITGNNPDFGYLKLGSGKYSQGEKINISDIGKLSFAAINEGTVSYTVKALADGSETLIGTVTLSINIKPEKSADLITYKTEINSPVSLNPQDFSKVCGELTGKDLSFVNFKTSSLTKGKLYCQYVSSSDVGSVVSDNGEYYLNKSPYLSDIKYIPESGYTGTVTISYTGYNTEGVSFTGDIEVTICDNDDGSGHFKDVGKKHAWASEAIDYLYKENIITGSKPGYYNPDASIKRGDFILMLCRAFDLNIDKSNKNDSFSDVKKNSYYYEAIAAAKTLGIVKGSNGKFNPNSALSRQDAMVLIARAMDAAGIDLEAGSRDDLKSFTDYGKISDYAVDSVAALVKAGIIQGNGCKLNPKSSVSRAEMAVILYRILEK